MGAVLSRDYLEPHFDGEAKNPWCFLEPTRYKLEMQGDCIYDDWIRNMPMESDEVEHFYRYPIYNFWPHPGWEDCFGGFGDWLIIKTRKRLQSESPVSPDGEGSDNAFGGEALREVMQLLVMYGQMADMKDGPLPLNQEPFWIRHFPGEFGGCMCNPDKMLEDEEDQETHPPLDSYRKVDVVFSRAWAPRTTYIRARLFESESGDEADFFHDEIERPRGMADMCDVVDILELLHCFSDRPNRINGHSAPHPPLHLFVFILRKYFGYRFDDLAFEMNSKEPIYKNFIRNGRVFTQDGEWQGMLTSTNSEEIQTKLRLGFADNPEYSDGE